MKEKKITTHSLIETHVLGEKIGRNCKENMLFLLDGDLGAGKTTLTQGIAKGLDVKRNVTSPTFTIQKIYKGRMPLYHIDAYRLEGISQDLGFEDFFFENGVTVIEWAQFIEDIIPDEYMKISISLMENEDREFVLAANGKVYEDLLEVMQ